MDYIRSLEPILKTFVQHLERLQSEGGQPSELLAFLESQCNTIASDPHSKHLPSIFRSRFKRMVFEFMMSFLRENIPSTSSISHSPVPPHDPNNGTSKEMEDVEFAREKDEESEEEDSATDESENSEGEIKLGHYLKDVAVDSVHQPMV